MMKLTKTTMNKLLEPIAKALMDFMDEASARDRAELILEEIFAGGIMELHEMRKEREGMLETYGD